MPFLASTEAYNTALAKASAYAAPSYFVLEEWSRFVTSVSRTETDVTDLAGYFLRQFLFLIGSRACPGVARAMGGWCYFLMPGSYIWHELDLGCNTVKVELFEVVFQRILEATAANGFNSLPF